MKNLKKQRELANLSQARLSIRSGVSRFKISQSECGYARLTNDEERKVNEAIQKWVKELERQP